MPEGRVHGPAQQGQGATRARLWALPDLFCAARPDVAHGLTEAGAGLDVTGGQDPVGPQAVTAMPSAVVYGNIFEVVGKGKELAFAGLDRITASLASYQFHDRPLELGNLGGILQIKALPLLRLRELDGIEVDRGRPDGHRPVHQPAQIAVVVAMYRWLDAYGEILSASVAALHQHSDTPAHPFEGAIDAPCPVVDLAGRPVGRQIDR